MIGEKIHIDSDNEIKLHDLVDENDAEVIGATAKLYLFKEDTLNIDPATLTFTGGGVAEPEVGDFIDGAISSAFAEITFILLTSGSWGAGTAAGIMGIKNQVGTFQAEDLDQMYGQANIATVAADSSGPVSAAAGAKTTLPIRNHGLLAGQWIHIQGTVDFDGFHQVDAAVAPTWETITIAVAFPGAPEKFDGTEVVYAGMAGGCDIGMSDDGGGDYSGVLPETIEGLIEDAYYYRIIFVTKATSTLTIKQRIRATYYLE